MALISLPKGINGTPLPNTPTTGQYFRYQGPDAEITPEAIARVKKLHELYPHILGAYIEGKREGALDEPPTRTIFVYGANTEGRHGKGAAKTAMQQHGAVYGRTGLQGMSYGVVTKELRPNHPPVTLDRIEREIVHLLRCCAAHPTDRFVCTPFGTGLAGFTHGEIVEILMRYELPSNLFLPDEWQAMIDAPTPF